MAITWLGVNIGKLHEIAKKQKKEHSMNKKSLKPDENNFLFV